MWVSPNVQDSGSPLSAFCRVFVTPLVDLVNGKTNGGFSDGNSERLHGNDVGVYLNLHG